MLLLKKKNHKEDYLYLKACCFFELNKLEESLKQAMNALVKGYLAEKCNEIFVKIYNNIGDTYYNKT